MCRNEAKITAAAGLKKGRQQSRLPSGTEKRIGMKQKECRKDPAVVIQKNNARGDAMIIVLCILMLFMVLSFSILTASAVVLGTAKKNAVSERCKTAASTFSAMMEEQLVQKRDKNPLHLQKFFMEMVHEKMKLQPGTEIERFYFDEDLDEAEDSYVQKISIKNAGKEIGEYLNGYDVRIEIVWIGSLEVFKDSYKDKVEDWPEGNKLPVECSYSGIKLKVTTICENKKFHESYKATVFYDIQIEGEAGKDSVDVWKFTTDGRTTT